MTFHGRLRLFFTIIVVVPMLAIAVVLFTLTADSERGKADAGIAAGLDFALSLHAEGQRAARGELQHMAADRRLTSALSSGDDRAVRARLRRLVRADKGTVSARLADATGKEIAVAGSRRGAAFDRSFLVSPHGHRRLGTLSVSVTDARKFVRSAAARMHLEFVLLRDGRAIATTVPEILTVPRETGEVTAGGREYRGRRILTGKAAGATEEIAVFREAGDINSAISTSRMLIGAILGVFLVLALGTSVFVVRALQDQIGQFLAAARGLASGRFRQPVPTEGNDEFAELGREFNRMSTQLETKILEVERRRNDLQETIRRLGEPFSRSLEPQQFLQFVVRTALDACEAESARGLPSGGSGFAETHAGRHDSGLDAALAQAERAFQSDVGAYNGAAGAGGRGSPLAVERDGVHALAAPLTVRLGAESSETQIALMSIARRDRPFAREERELLVLLKGFAEVWIENADMYATLREQAVTDPGTGLPGQSAMDEAIDREIERHHRFGAPVGLVWLDLDGFKAVNDTHGHDQGDDVLIAVAGVLRRESRELDTPARRHGDEFAMVLPETDLDGAEEAATRILNRLNAIRIPRRDGRGDLSVTASFGVASVPFNALEREELRTAADAALYRAKRGGRNGVERASGREGGRAAAMRPE